MVPCVVSYRNSTSNHNAVYGWSQCSWLYLIEILHQTTTHERPLLFLPGCILSKFYIKPQLRMFLKYRKVCCILSKFYIKPQHDLKIDVIEYSCILSKFYIKPQLCTTQERRDQRCILSKFYIKPQPTPERNC